MSSARAASMSSTTRSSPCTEPGAAVVTPLPKMMEHGEPGGVNCTTRQSSAAGEVGVQPPPQALVEALGAIDVGHRNDDDLELRFDHPIAREPVARSLLSCAVLMVTSAGW